MCIIKYIRYFCIHLYIPTYVVTISGRREPRGLVPSFQLRLHRPSEVNLGKLAPLKSLVHHFENSQACIWPKKKGSEENREEQ